MQRPLLFNSFNSLPFTNYSTKYFLNAEEIQNKLHEYYIGCLLEEVLPTHKVLSKCLLNGGYTYSKKSTIPIDVLKAFLDLLRSSSKEKKNIINLHNRLDLIDRHQPQTLQDIDDDIPF